MMTALRSRTVRQALPYPNLTLFRCYADVNNTETEDSKAVSSQILQNDRCQQLSTKDEKLPTQNSQVVPKQTVNDYPKEPTICCMSGCANCVWLEYAEKLCAYYCDGGERAIKEVNEKISDPNIKAFILQELRNMKYK